MSQDWHLGRRPGLDGLRGVAIAMVVAAHAVDAPYYAGGSIGVTLFFGLSGFLITSLLLEEHRAAGRISLCQFYARRARRLLPALTVMLMAVVTFEASVGMPTRGATLAVAAYVSNWAHISGVPLGFLSHTWSLAVEEQFYLAWPWMLLILLRRAPQRVVTWCVAGAAVSMAARFVLWFDGASAARIYEGTDTRADALLTGCALAGALAAGRRLHAPGGVGAAVLVTLVALGFWRGELAHTLVGPTICTVAMVPVLLVATESPSWLCLPWLRWLGTRSYALYLWHVPLVYAVEQVTGPTLLAKACALAATVGLAELSWRVVESPLLSSSRRSAPPPRPPTEQVASAPNIDEQHGRPHGVGIRHTREFNPGGELT